MTRRYVNQLFAMLSKMVAGMYQLIRKAPCLGPFNDGGTLSLEATEEPDKDDDDDEDYKDGDDNDDDQHSCVDTILVINTVKSFKILETRILLSIFVIVWGSEGW
jgi:hypothetical protein